MGCRRPHLFTPASSPSEHAHGSFRSEITFEIDECARSTHVMRVGAGAHARRGKGVNDNLRRVRFIVCDCAAKVHRARRMNGRGDEADVLVAVMRAVA